jgi:DNA-directed RNA polymerase specialized sigma24 family protein
MSTRLSAQHLRDDLARADLRDAVTRLVLARVPSADVDDVVQTTFCAALSSERVPEDRVRRARWVVGIARHKIADYYRRVGRLELDGFVDPLGPQPAHEERDLLTALVDETQSDERARQTLDWIVREHCGERFADIARAENESATVVRKRVSRLRRALRERWLPVMAALSVCAGALCVAVAIGRAWPFDATEHRAVGSSAVLESGRWSVATVDGVPATGIELELRGGAFTLRTPAETWRGEIRSDDGALVATTNRGRKLRAMVLRSSSDELVVLADSGTWTGEVVLRRMR